MDLRALRTFRFGSDNIRRGMPVTMSETRAKEHLARGLVAPATEAEVAASVDDLDGRKVDELTALASGEGIDLGEAKKKADIIAAIRAHRAKA